MHIRLVNRISKTILDRGSGVMMGDIGDNIFIALLLPIECCIKGGY
jgi:hypothetical protein